MTRTQGVMMAKAGLQLQGVLAQPRRPGCRSPRRPTTRSPLLRADLVAAGLLAA